MSISMCNEMEILEKTFEIDMLKINNVYTKENAYYELAFEEGHLFESGEDLKESKKGFFTSAIDKIISTVSRLIDSVIDLIGNLFSGKEHITASDYVQSDTGKTKLKYDVNKISDAIDDEIVKGRSLVQKISSKTGIDDKEVARYLDTGANILSNIGPVLIAGGVTAILSHKFANKMRDKKSKFSSLGEMAKSGNNDEKARKQKMSILNHISSLISKGTKMSTEAIKEASDVSK